MKIKEKVLKKQRERNKLDIDNKLSPLWDIKEESMYSGMYKEIIELIEAIAIACSEDTLAEVSKIIDEIEVGVDDGFHPVEEHCNSRELKQKLGI